MTLKEVAARAGVSVSTVSRIINSADGSFARKETQDRVWAVIKETGYMPNQSARNLKRGKTGVQQIPAGTFACILGRAKTLDDDPFFAQLAQVIEQQAMERNYPVRLSYSVLDIKMIPTLEKIESANVDGAIVLGRFSEAATAFLECHYKNIVYVGRNLIHAEWDQVICDGYEATQMAIEHLVSYGHRRIGYIGETGDEIRYQAYRDMICKCGLEDNRRLVCNVPHTGEGGYRGADLLLRAGAGLPTAVFCAADVSAIAALRRFREARIKVPEQLSIISMDNIELSSYVTPMLTTVGMPIAEVGSMAVQLLISRIHKQHRLPLKLYLPNKLLRRESVFNINEGMYI
ncbi:transcriptional regulator, LacI family [Lacrimispora sphenoides]|jgi:LacI family transcriptional regulator|uniref:LacI family DNA-binding transcriptional regulator n=1 Tax=Lacrimispora sphenoides TaxID=29370 RepID=UPI0008CB9583|nr:LacI family DNA-binding transcriptional regulator [Lacrimispora sphenoides]SET75303.1 transcriptional regulator, LacI family [Lacrimispora sphenoides]